MFTGWGCKKAPTPTDTGVEEPTVEDAGVKEEGDEILAGWKEYRNEELGVSFEYPSDWFFRDYRETVGGEATLVIAFSDEVIPDSLPLQPVFPISVSHENKTVGEIAVTYTEAISIDNLTIGTKAIKRVVYFSNMLEQNYDIYLVPAREGALQLLVLGPSYKSVAENMIVTLETE